eukprot:jgi/Mesvir1/22841/Mv20100-RA.2
MASLRLSNHDSRGVGMVTAFMLVLALFATPASAIPTASSDAAQMTAWSIKDSLAAGDQSVSEPSGAQGMRREPQVSRQKPSLNAYADSTPLTAAQADHGATPPAICYFQTPAPDGPEGPFLRLTRIPDSANRPLPAPPPGISVAGVWSVERLCGYVGILEPESTVDLPRPAQDWPPLGCQHQDALAGDRGRSAGVRFDESFVAIELADAAKGRPLPATPATHDGPSRSDEGMRLLFARRMTRDGRQHTGGDDRVMDASAVVSSPGLELEVICAGEGGSLLLKPLRDALASVTGDGGQSLKLGVAVSGDLGGMVATVRSDSACVWPTPGGSAGARLLSGVADGGITKADVELVVAQYARDVAWSDVFAPIRTVYSKAEKTEPGFIRLDNVGRESHSFLTHIIRNYDNLAATTVFVQDHRPGISHTIGPQEHQHLHSRSTLMDYLLSTAPVHMILGDAVTPDITLGAARLGRVWDLPLARPLPPFVSDQWREGGDPLVLDTWLPLTPNEGLRLRLGRACEPFSESDSYDGCLFTLDEFWRDISQHSPALPKQPPWWLPSDAPEDALARGAGPQLRGGSNPSDGSGETPQGLVFFAQGAPMALSRDAIRRHPKAFYEKLLEHLAMSQDPIAGYYAEMSWQYIFDPAVDEQALMARYWWQTRLARVAEGMSTEEVLARVAAAHPKLVEMLVRGAGKLPAGHGGVEPKEVVMRRQLIQTRTGGAYGPAIDVDAPLLRQFKESVVYNSLRCDLESWGVSGSNPCLWPGIECDVANRVSSINLYQCGLSGTLPRSIYDLPFLTMLELGDNSISGFIPEPSGNMYKLTHLSVFNNRLSGFVPETLSGLTSLTVLSFHSNHLSGTLPLILSELQYISYLDVYNNPLLCGYPHINPIILDDVRNTSLNQPCSAEELQALHTWASGLQDPSNFLESWSGDDVCSFLGVNCDDLGRVQEMNLGYSGLHGDLTTFPALSKLSYIGVHYNSFSGFLPTSLSDMPSLTAIDFQHNHISGTIGSWALGDLQILGLTENRISGTIPNKLSENSPLLTYIFLGSNQLSGTVPASLANLTLLGGMTMVSNPLSGCLPPFRGSISLFYEYTALNDSVGCVPGQEPGRDTGVITLECPPPRTIAVSPSFLGVNCPLPGDTRVPGIVDNAPCPDSVIDFLNVTAEDSLGRPVQVTYSPITFEKGITKQVTWTASANGTRSLDAATANCTSSLTLVSQLPLVAIEVTQAVQDWEHSVPLVAGKATLVRAFLQLDVEDRRDSVLMDASLEVYRGQTRLGTLSKVNTDGNMLVVKNVTAARGYNRGAFNFLLPKSWTTPGDLTVCFVAAENPLFRNISAVTCTEQDAGVNDEPGDCCLTARFFSVNEPCFRFIKVRYMENGELRELSDRAMREQWRRFRSMLPIPADSRAEFRTLDYIYEQRPSLRLVNNALDAARIVDKGERRCWYIGLLRGTGAGLAAFNGETSAYFVGRPETSFACGYERNRGVHEFLHNLNITHAKQDGKTACTNTDQEEGDEFPFLQAVDANGTVIRPTLGPMGDPMTEVFGTDPVLVAAGAPSVVSFSSPRFVFALMSYCQPLNFFGCQSRWIDKATYIKALEEIHVRAPQGAQPVGGSTVLNKVVLRGTIQLDNQGQYDVQVEPLLQVCTSIDISSRTSQEASELLVEFARNDVVQSNFTINRSTLSSDLLTCTDPDNSDCATQGSSDVFGDFSQDFSIGSGGCMFCFASFDLFTFFSFDFFATFSFDFLPTFSFDAFPTFSFDFFPQFSFDGFPFFTFDGVPFLLYDGSPQSQLDGPKASVPAANAFFVSTEFAGFAEDTPADSNDFDGVGKGKIDFKLALDVVLPAEAEDLSSDPYSIRFRVADDLSLEPVKVLFLSTSAPVIEDVAKVPAGSVSEESEVQICFKASDVDPENVTLTATVHYCPNYLTDVCACETLALDLPLNRTLPLEEPEQACVAFARSRLAKSDGAIFRVFLSDGLRASVAETPTFNVTNNLPYVELLFPTNNSYSVLGANEILLKGTADDVEDGPVTNCHWYEASDAGNLVLLASGVETTILSTELRATAPDQPCVSTHVIRLSCMDGDEGESSDETTHTVTGSGTPPTINCPEDPVLTFEADPSTCLALVTFPAITAADGCSGEALTPTLVEPAGFVNGSSFPAGDTVVRYRVAEAFTRASAECQFIVRVTAPPNACFTPVPGSVPCDLTCNDLGSGGPYVVQFTADLEVSEPITLTDAQVCEWNRIWGTLGAVADPTDPCQVESFEPSLPTRRRNLLTSRFLRVTRLYFLDEGSARAAAALLADALASGRLLAALRRVLPVIRIIDVGVLFLWLTAVTSDPHFQGPCGEQFDFMGAAGESYCIITSARVHVNAKMMGAVAAAVEGAEETVDSKHTWMEEVAVRYGSTRVVISALSPPGTGYAAQQGRIWINGAEMGPQLAPKSIIREGGIKLERGKTRIKLTLGPHARLVVEVVRAAWWEAGRGPGRNFLNLKVVSTAATLEWHGVLGGFLQPLP